MKLLNTILCSAIGLTLSANVSANIYKECYVGKKLSSPSDTIKNNRYNDFDTDYRKSFDDYVKKTRNDFDVSKEEMERRFIQYRDSVIDDFVKTLYKPWDKEESKAALPKPIDNSVGPQLLPIDDTVIKDDDKRTTPVPQEDVDDNTIPDEQNEPVDKPTPKKSPLPYKPITIHPKHVLEIPILDESKRPVPFVPIVMPKQMPDTDLFAFSVFGTDMQVSLDNSCRFSLTTCNNSVAEAVSLIASNNKYTVLLQECLDIRGEYQLCDWAYLKTLEAMSNAFLGKDTNEARLLTGYLFCMSGYKIRFAFVGDNELIILGACDQSIVNTPYLTLNDSKGSDTYYILIGNSNFRTLQICNYEMPSEKAMSLNIYKEPLFDNDIKNLNMQLHSYSDISFDYIINKNLIDFYDTYPTPLTKGDSYSKWVYYANTPMSAAAKHSLYPAIMRAIEGKDAREQTDIIMDFIESFEYGYDDEIWGFDRAFFPDETIFYPQSDCEDHAILLTRLVRDLLGLETALVYYPGHLAAAVCFNDSYSEDDHIIYNGKKYTICDPTIYYSGSGRTMRGMHNEEATLIIVR